MKKSIIGLALLAAMGAGSVNAQTSPDDYEIKDTPEGKTLYVKGKVEISSYEDLVKYLGYGTGDGQGQEIMTTKVTEKPDAEKVYYLRVQSENEKWDLNTIQSLVNASKDEGTIIGYKDASAFSVEEGEPSGQKISLPSADNAYHVVIEKNGILKINELKAENRTESVQVINKGSFSTQDAKRPKTFSDFWLWALFEYVNYMWLGWDGSYWANDIDVIYTMNNGTPSIIDYYVPGHKSAILTYYKYEAGTDKEETKTYSFGDIVAMKSLTICSETQCNDEGNIYTTQTGQFYNHNYAWYGETPSDAPTEEIMKDPLTRIHEAMSKLRIGKFYRDEQGLHDGAPDIRFQKTYLNTEPMTFYPLSIPFFTNSKYESGVIKHDGYADPGYNKSYYIGLYSAQHRSENKGSELGSWKEVYDELIHPKAFQAGATGTFDMPHYRAYEIIFAEGGTNTITFKNQSLLSNNENSYVKGLLPYYMADGGTYVTEKVSTTKANAYWSRFAVWRHPLYFSDKTGDEDDYWHFFANPMPYRVKIVQGGYIYAPGQPITEPRTSEWTKFSDGEKGDPDAIFTISYMIMRDGIGDYETSRKFTESTEPEIVPSIFTAGDPFFIRSKHTVVDRPVGNNDYFIEDRLDGDTNKEAIISYEGELLNEQNTRSALRSVNSSLTTQINLVEKDTKYNTHTYLLADKNALDTQSAYDDFVMHGGTLNIWTNRDDYKLGAYGYNPDNGTTIPLGLTTYKGGEYEITADNIPAGVEMWIYKAGKPVCCLNDGAYTFSAPKSTRVDDLTLVTRGTDPTANEEISANEQNIRAYMVGSTCRIEGLEAGMTYNVYAISGATVANGTAHANVANVALPTPGVYVVKVVSIDNEEQVIKIKY